MFIWNLSFLLVVQIGFEKTSYTVGEGDKSVSVCVKLIAGTITTPVSVTLVTMETVSADGMFSEWERFKQTTPEIF